MQYEDILKKIEQDQENNTSIDLYRYNGLLEAIQYFANRLSMEQITDTAFDFVNELLTTNKSTMFLIENGNFVLKKERGIKNAPLTLPLTTELSCFALYVGNVIFGKENLQCYFEQSALEALDATVMLPLMLEDKLYGFFLLSGKIASSFNESDILVCETLMNLFNNALESCNRLEKLQISNRELDEKIFNLFAINQSAKAMLTEHRLDMLYRLAVDVFSELTQSAHTGFILYDNPSEKYILKAYRDVFSNNEKPNITMKLNTNDAINFNRQLLDLSKADDSDYLLSLFDDADNLLQQINAHYVVFIYGNEKLLGFVTLGETVSGAPYKESAFELVDSLASYTYISLYNAMLIDLVNEQKSLLQRKLDRLSRLNSLSKNINSATDVSLLLELTMETLTISFGVEDAFIALYDTENNNLKISHSSDITLEGTTIPMNSELDSLRCGRTLFECDANNVSAYVGDEISNAISNSAGLLIVPMALERCDTVFVGAIFIFKLKDGLLSEEENILTFETIANQIAPLIYGFTDIENHKKLYKLDIVQTFSIELEKQLKECINYDFDIEIIDIKNNAASPFKENVISQILSEYFENVYPISYDRTEVILLKDFEYSASVINSALADNNIEVRRLKLGSDFTDIEGFYKTCF